VVIKNDFGLSLGLHAAIFLAFLLAMQNRAAHDLPAPILVQVEALDSTRAEKNPQRRAAAPTQQVVRTREADNRQAPDEKAFLGEHNQTVERQQVTSRGGERVGSRPQAEQKAPVKLSDLGVAVLPAERSKRSIQLGDAAVREFVSGMKEGEETALSTKEFVFYGYFERIRARLDRAWEPILREHLMRHYRQGRRLASERDHSTLVVVTLDAMGKIVRVEVTGESGIETLDSAAIEAFNHAGPFPNPPKGLVDSSGSVQIKWEFILKT